VDRQLLALPAQAQDLDVLVDAANATTARERLRAAGFTLVTPLAVGGSTWRAPEGWWLDLIEEFDQLVIG
jgi:hypothetical protein